MPEHHERLVRNVDGLLSQLESLPIPNLHHVKPTLRKDWLTTPAEFLLLLTIVEEMTEHTRQIGRLHGAFIDGIRAIAREAGVSAEEIEGLGQVRASAN
jgi:hypothetical protein